MNRQMRHNETQPATGGGISYIIWGGGAQARAALAEKLAAAHVCSGSGERPCGACAHCLKSARGLHPDIGTLDRRGDTRTIYVDQIRALREDVVVMPNEAEGKAYIIRHAGDMNTSAQNALLKVLEEPPGNVRFILVTENIARLLPTVRSRCVALYAGGAAPEPVGAAAAADFFGAWLGGPVTLVEFCFTLDKLGKNEFGDFLDGVRRLLADRLRDGAGGEPGNPPRERLMDAVGVFDRAAEYFNSNVGLGHIAGMICARLMT